MTTDRHTHTGPQPLRAGVARVDITSTAAGPPNDPLHARALVITDGATTAVVVSVDAVALEEIGPIPGDTLPTVRQRLQEELGIEPGNVIINASHCHGAVCEDVADRTVQAVKAAWEGMVPVRVGAGRGHEDRIMENRRLRLKNGREADVRRAYSLPPDDEIAAVGPVDPEIGVLRLDRMDGGTLAVAYNFSCHPIQGVPGGGNTADITGFSSAVIERNTGEGAVALFLQGCSGDVSPILYKDVDSPRDAEPLGNLLALSTLDAVRDITCREGAALRVVSDVVGLPRADLSPYITALEQEQDRLVGSFRPTCVNLKTFLHLLTKHSLNPEYPSHYAHRYLHEAAQGRKHLEALDAENREQLANYTANVLTMEELTRVQTNLGLLRMHQAKNEAAGWAPRQAEVVGLRIGDFVLLTFTGELSVQIGLDIKAASPHDLTFISGCTNGYTYYAPTVEQLQNRGGAQEDSDCFMAPEWLGLFEEKARQVLGRL